MAVDLWQYRDSIDIAATKLDLAGFEVVATDGSVGTVDRASNDVGVTYLVVDTDGGAGGRRVLLPAGTVESIDVDARRVHLDRSRADVAGAPEFDPDDEGDVSFQDALSGYYHGLYGHGL